MKDSIDALRQRIRTDFRLGIYLVFGALGVLVLLPISFVRLAQGSIGHALVNLCMVGLIVAATAAAWRGANLHRLGRVVVLAVTVGGCAATWVAGAGLYWLFPVVMASAFIVGPRLAVAQCLLIIGFLLVEQSALQGSDEPLAMLTALAVTSGFALIFARQSDRHRVQLEQLVTRDALTGAENRRALEVELEIAIAGFRRDGRPMALALVDLDHFKKINDRFGHDVGDRVLREFVHVVQASVRRTDRLFRYGGEEFVLLMPATDELGLELAMSHLRTQIRGGLSAGGEPVTVSIGGAILRVGEDRASWFARADDALYRAKASGRNRLEIDGAEG